MHHLRKYFFISGFFIIFSLTSVIIFNVHAESLSKIFSGRILLQVEEKGEAWYVNPTKILHEPCK